MTAQLVVDALVVAIWRRGQPPTLPHHSDRGSPYTGEPFQRLMAGQGIACSVSRSGAFSSTADTAGCPVRLAAVSLVVGG